MFCTVVCLIHLKSIEQINQTYSLYILSIVNNTFVHINVMVSENMNTLLVLLTKMLLSETACLYCSY